MNINDVPNLGEAEMEALKSVGFDLLSPGGQEYIARKLRSVGEAIAGRRGAPTPEGVLALRTGYGRDRPRGVGEAGDPSTLPIPSVEDAARSVVRFAYRAAPRAWAEVGDAEMAALDAYPPLEEVPVLAEAAYPGLSDEELGERWLGVAEDGQLLALDVAGGASDAGAAVGGTPITAPLGADGRGPSAAAEETFLKLSADWEAFGRMRVGEAALPSMRADVGAWRAARGAWLSGRVAPASIGQLLSREKERATKVRHALREVGAADDEAKDKGLCVVTVKGIGVVYRGDDRREAQRLYDLHITAGDEVSMACQLGDQAFWDRVERLGSLALRVILGPVPLVSFVMICWSAWDRYKRLEGRVDALEGWKDASDTLDASDAPNAA